MSLTYDPSAIRYASTQEAYGCTWTLNKIEDDGAQVWKNSQGQEAIVPKICSAAWKPLDVDQASWQFSAVKRVLISDDRKRRQTSIHTNVAINDSNGQVIDGCFYDRALTSEEVAKIFNEGYGAVPGGKKLTFDNLSGDGGSPTPNGPKYPPLERVLGVPPNAYDKQIQESIAAKQAEGIVSKMKEAGLLNYGHFRTDPPYSRGYGNADSGRISPTVQSANDGPKCDEVRTAGNSLGVQEVKKKLRLTAQKGDEILTRDKRHLRFDGEKWRPF